MLKLQQRKPVVEADAGTTKRILLDPGLGTDPKRLPQELRTILSAPELKTEPYTVEIGYEHKSAEQVLKRLLPAGMVIPSAFEGVGHIAHLNLKPEHEPYKFDIGQVLLDKTNASIESVVTKVGTINNVYRNFDMELLAGKDQMVTEHREHGSRFRFDFSKVYWNSRLGEEHSRLVASFQASDVVADMMAGVGPFAVPAGRRGIRVHANDLNPESFKWLQSNIELNKVEDRVSAYNMDGRAFIQALGASGVRFNRVVMNLPASALEFLDVFANWSGHRIRIHCYCFSSPEKAFEQISARARTALGLTDPKAAIGDNVALVDVRDVAPKKHMYRLDFELGSTKTVLGKRSDPESSANDGYGSPGLGKEPMLPKHPSKKAKS